MNRKLYVGNLPYQTGEEELQELFGQSGTVDSIHIARDTSTGRARGFAFVEMATAEEASGAVDKLNGYELSGRALTVNEARPKVNAGGGGGGGFGSGAGGKRTRREPRW